MIGHEEFKNEQACVEWDCLPSPQAGVCGDPGKTNIMASHGSGID